MRQDVAGSLRCITGDHQALVDTKVHRDHDREGEQVEESCDWCSFALRLIHSAGRHFRSSIERDKVVWMNIRHSEAREFRPMLRLPGELMFHHLEAKDREKTLGEVRRVLKLAGAFYLLDFEVSQSASRHWLFRIFHSSERLRDNSEDRILTLMRDAGFSESKQFAIQPVLFGLGLAGYYQGTAR